MERLEEELKVEEELEKEREAKVEDMDVDQMDTGILERRDDVERSWERGTQGILELGKVPGVLAKLERAGRAVEVIEGM
jgi:hypothetical protein